MARPPSRHPTETELDILKVLWQGGPLPVREVRDRLARDPAITSVTTIMNIMVEKGYLARRKPDGSSSALSSPPKGYVYSARVSEKATTRRMLADLVDRAFDGSPAAAAVRLLESADLDVAEIRRLRELLKSKLGEAER